MTATTPAPVEVTAADRDALERIDGALGFLMEDERELVLQAFAAHRIQVLSARPVQADLVEAAGRLLASLDPHTLNLEQFNAWCDLDTTLTRATGDGA